jgi:Family of unknown function (DUF6491)
MRSELIVIASTTLAVLGCSTAPTTDADDRAAAERETDCVRTSLIRDWEALDERNLIVYEGRRPYHVELAQTCFGLDFETMIGLYDRRGDGRICGFGLDRVIVDRAIPEDCSIAAVDELTDEQAEELKRRAEAEAEAARDRPRAQR